MENKQKVVGVVCHDAGGAEIVSSYISLNDITAEYCLEGPAIKVFERKFGEIKNNSLSELIGNSNWLLCGTSGRSDLEWRAIQEFSKKARKTVAFLDHWVNYPKRFSRNDTIVLPNEIWVGDAHAQKIAEISFPKTKIRLVENPYLLEMKEVLNSLKPKNKLAEKHTALYLCEPTADLSSYTEHDSLQFFMDNIDKVDKDIGAIVIRFHPSEKNPKEKYKWAKNYPIKMPCNIQFSEEDNLMQNIVDCDVVIGMETMAMVVGLISEKRVISSILEKGKRCILPFLEIEHLSDLLDKHPGS